MALLAPLFALIGRFVGRVLTTTLGWASILLFGRVPQDRQVWLAVLTFGSIAWVAAIAGVILPDLGAVLLAAVPRPSWIPQEAVRLAMLAAAVLLPAILGAVTLLLFDPEDRPRGVALAQQVARGYGLVPALAVTLVILAIVGTARKLDSVVHRRQDAHIAIVVRPGRYEALVETLEATLRDGDLVTARRAGSSVLTVPARVLARIAGKGIGRLVPDQLVELYGPKVRLVVYPADLALTGSADAVARSRALVARDVRSEDAWFTTTKEAQQVEDRMAALEKADEATRLAQLPDLDRSLLDLIVDQDTFEVLYRRRLQLAIPPDADVHDGAESPRPATAPISVEALVGLAVAVLALADLVVTAVVSVRERFRGGRRRHPAR